MFSFYPVSLLSWLLAVSGLGVVGYGIFLGMGNAAAPGSGLWPVLVGFGLTVAAWFARPISPRRGKACSFPQRRVLCGFALACCLWPALTIPLGWMPATILVLVISGRAAGDSWAEILLLALLLVGGLYVGVEKLLQWPLPAGVLGELEDVAPAREGWSAGPVLAMEAWRPVPDFAGRGPFSPSERPFDVP